MVIYSTHTSSAGTRPEPRFPFLNGDGRIAIVGPIYFIYGCAGGSVILRIIHGNGTFVNIFGDALSYYPSGLRMWT